jgi:hypothetical protein
LNSVHRSTPAQPEADGIEAAKAGYGLAGSLRTRRDARRDSKPEAPKGEIGEATERAQYKPLRKACQDKLTARIAYLGWAIERVE